MAEDKKFTQIASDLLLDVRDLVNWGIDTGNTTPEKVRHTVAARAETGIKLVEGGASLRQAAKLLQCDHKTIAADWKRVRGENSPRSGENSPRRTGSAKVKRRRKKVAARAAAKGVTALPTDKYRVIYADPPWDYGAHLQPDYHPEQRDHYATMTVEAICAEPVKQWIENDAVLFLWVTSPMLERSFEVIHAWGFEYKASFVWDKIKHNMGHYNSVRHEFLLICTCGTCTPDTKQLTKQLFDSVQSIERTKHSAKPVEFYDIIETLYTHGACLEMYGRNKPYSDRWTVHGHVAELEAAE